MCIRDRPCIILDVPHQWNAWVKRTVLGADEILIVAEPELASLRNAKNLVDLSRACLLYTSRCV